MSDMMLKAALDVMEQALRSNTEAPFKAQWHAEGYAKNLVGGTGLAGEEVFSQAVDKVEMLFVKTDDASAYVALGGGENPAEVETLANRFLRKEPLEPPTEGT